VDPASPAPGYASAEQQGEYIQMQMNEDKNNTLSDEKFISNPSI
jgi:hypothetical protein